MQYHIIHGHYHDPKLSAQQHVEICDMREYG